MDLPEDRKVVSAVRRQGSGEDPGKGYRDAAKRGGMRKTDSAQLRAVRFDVEGTERRKSANLRKIPAENSCVPEDIMI